MVDRILRVIRLDWTVFREIALDPGAMTEAAIIVVVVTFLSAIGSGIVADHFFVGFIVGWIANILLNWILWAILTYFVGTMLFQGRTDISEMLRVLGYAVAPNLLGIFVFIPCLGWIAAIVGWVLSLIAGMFAVREAMEFDTGKAVVTILISWFVAIGIRAVIFAIF